MLLIMETNEKNGCCLTNCCQEEEQNTMTLSSDEEIRSSVREKYAAIALTQNGSGCCGPDCGEESLEVNFVGEDYAQLDGYQKVADLDLGCGLPTQFAQIKPGSTVVDLGSGAGNDAFIARQETGPSGKVIGIDFTKPMVERARANAAKLGYENVSFYHGDIEDIPLESNSVDVVVSNCVFNLIPNKQKAIAETHRILRTGGHFSISDIVTVGNIPEELKKEAELYAGCVAGAIPKSEYVQLFKDLGFNNIVIQKEREIKLPEEVVDAILSPDKKAIFQGSELGIFSITLYGEK
jgi:SAM-dependent methyltransferase